MSDVRLDRVHEHAIRTVPELKRGVCWAESALPVSQRPKRWDRLHERLPTSSTTSGGGVRTVNIKCSATWRHRSLGFAARELS
jgi:hypothetical protein